MTTQHPAGDGDTRPTDRERLTEWREEWRRPLPDDAPDYLRGNPAAAEDVLDRLAHRYGPVPVPQCRVCGADLTVASIGGGRNTEFACSAVQVGAEGWGKHYAESKWIEPNRGDTEVVTLVETVRALLAARAPAQPDAAQAQVAAVRALHQPVPIYDLPEDHSAYTLTQQIENGTASLHMRVCRACSTDEVLEQIEDWEIDFSDGAVHAAAYPCSTIEALDRLAAEPDAATRIVQVEVYVREPGPEVTEVDAVLAGCAVKVGTVPFPFLAAGFGPLSPVGTRARLRAAADPGTRGEGDDRG